MCVVSMIGDSWGNGFKDRYPGVMPWVTPAMPDPWPATIPYATPAIPTSVSREEFDALKKEIEELKKLLQAAKEYDAATGQPDCEVDAKVALIKAVANLVGVDMGDVFDEPKKKKAA